MVCNSLSASIETKKPVPSYELFRAIVTAKQPFYEFGLRWLTDYLPTTDLELLLWLKKAMATQDALAFRFMICTAAMANRKLPASLLPGGAAFIEDQYQLGWIAWHMEGEVTDELLKAAAKGGLLRPKLAMMLFYAAAWWLKFRKGPLPPALLTAARAEARRRPVNGESAVILTALFTLAPNEALQDLVPCGRDPHLLGGAPGMRDGFLKMLEDEFAILVPEKVESAYTLGRPMRRAVEDIGRNERCPCGSGRKYKRCCVEKDQERLRHSTDVTGKTDMELYYEPHTDLTAARMAALPTDELVRLKEVPEALMEDYFLRLAECKRFDVVTRLFKKHGVREEWESLWMQLFSFIVQEWQRAAAKQLLKTHPRPKEMLPKLGPGVRLLLASDNLKKFFPAVEAEALATLRSGSALELEQFVCAVLASPYPALGIFVARSVLPLVKETKTTASVFDQILHARDRLDLSADDEFSDFMDERALQRKKGGGDRMDDAQALLGAKAEEVRGLKESLAQALRAKALQQKKENRLESESAPSSRQDTEQLKKIKWLEAKIREEIEEKVVARREVVRLEQTKQPTASELNGASKPEISDDDDAGAALQVAGTQPVRLLEFPKKFSQTMGGFPQHVGRAVMHYLGQLSAGDATAFDTVVHLKAYPGVLRKRIAGSHRLLFTLETDRVCVVDLIARCDLDKRIKRLQANGLPSRNSESS